MTILQVDAVDAVDARATWALSAHPASGFFKLRVENSILNSGITYATVKPVVTFPSEDMVTPLFIGVDIDMNMKHMKHMKPYETHVLFPWLLVHLLFLPIKSGKNPAFLQDALQPDVIAHTALLDLYAKLGDLEALRRLLATMAPNVVSFTVRPALADGYTICRWFLTFFF